MHHKRLPFSPAAHFAAATALGLALLSDAAASPTMDARDPSVTYQYVRPAKAIRGADPMGCGEFYCPRVDRVHLAIDYVVDPGQQLLAPITGYVRRFGKPYADSNLTLVEIWSVDGQVICRLLYVQPSVERGSLVQAGSVVGNAQDVRSRPEYVGKHMLPHAHVDCKIGGVRVDPERDSHFVAGGTR